MPSVSYSQRPGTDYGQESAALASIYAYVVQRHRMKQAAVDQDGGEDDAEGSNDGIGANQSISDKS